jgi:serine/threonine protein phosphatase 1
MSTIAVGDIHGNFAALSDLLLQLRKTVRHGDVIVFLGDYIDRGPHARQCVDAILALQQEVDNDVVGLCGNHEDWFLRTLHDYRQHSWLLGMNAYETIRSYSVDAAQVLRDAASKAGAKLYFDDCALPYDVFLDCLPKAHLHFFEGLRSFYQTADCICTHGGLDPRVSRLEDQARRDLIWGTSEFPAGYDRGEAVVYGHRNNAVLDADRWPTPAIVGRTIGLDTIAHGVLTAIKLPEQQLFQSARYEAYGSNVY